MRNQRLLRALAFVLAMVLCLTVCAAAMAGDYRKLVFGDQNDDVRELQNALKKKGFYSGAVDGTFGASTKKAVEKFQAYVGITVDGKAGNKTLTALYEGKSALNGDADREKLHQADVVVKNPRTLYYGCTGSRVRQLQRALHKAGCYNGAYDGKYGDLTYEAVKKYQTQRGLHADGIAGTKTLNSLYKKTNIKVASGFILDIGSTGREVDRINNLLQAYGAAGGTSYTEQTKEAVKNWQQATGRDVTGTITESQYNSLVLNQNKNK